MDPNVAISVNHVSKRFVLPHERQNSIKGRVINFRKRGYETQQVLDDVTFDVKKGEFFGIVGKNGSGKSTLLKLLAGIYTPDAGTIALEGKLTPFIELGVGFNPELSGRDNVFLNGALLGFSRKEMEALYDSIVAFAELERFMDQKLKNYSSGMQVRLAFSIAIRAQSDILILDEVLAVGDAAFQQKCFDYFNELKRNKKTIVFVTHDMSAVNRFCDRAILIQGGKIVHEGKPNEIADMYLEANISAPVKEEDDTIGRPTATLSRRSLGAGEELTLTIRYSLNEAIEHFVGISLLAGGLSFAEINTKHDIPTFVGRKGRNMLTLTIDTSGINSGTYDIGIAVFATGNGALASFNNKAGSFVIKAHDESRGGPMRLDARWHRDAN